MGRQSSRLIYKGKDHKDIYFQGHYHDAMYVGSRLVWEKIPDKIEVITFSDTKMQSGEVSPDMLAEDCFVTNDGNIVIFFTKDYSLRKMPVIFYDGNEKGFYVQSGGFFKISGENVGVGASGGQIPIIVIPDIGLNVKNLTWPEGAGYLSEDDTAYIGDYLIYFSGVSQFGTVSAYYNIRTEEIETPSCTIDGKKIRILKSPYEKYELPCFNLEEVQWFNNKLYAYLHATLEDEEWTESFGWCSSEDGINWISGSEIKSVGYIINDILFCDDGTAYDTSLSEVSYTKKPAFFYNGYYYAKNFENEYLLRSKDLKTWENYRRIRNSSRYTVVAYWKEMRYLCIKNDYYVFKYKLNL